MTPDEDLREALDELGALTPAGIARLLQREGITGLPRALCGCPLAVYLSRRCGFRVDVDGDLVWLSRGNTNPTWLGGDDGEIATPESVRRFIRTFDSGTRYRFLIAKAVA